MLEHRIQQHFIDSADLKYQGGPALVKALSQAVQALLACVTSGGKVLACGAGVSNLLAAQFAAHFIGRLERERPALAALALPGSADDPAADTPASADPQGFARQLRALGEAGDVLLALSPSGEAASVLAAVAAAHAREMTVIAFTGGMGSSAGGAVGRALRETDVHICVPHERALRVHEVHLTALHCLCDGVDAQLLGDPDADVLSATA
jgi:D-sedoheptulose 7-phosphate isomerase